MYIYQAPQDFRYCQAQATNLCVRVCLWQEEKRDKDWKKEEKEKKKEEKEGKEKKKEEKEGKKVKAKDKEKKKSKHGRMDLKAPPPPTSKGLAPSLPPPDSFLNIVYCTFC